LSFAGIANAETYDESAFLHDAHFIRDKLLLNHPGTSNADDPGFNAFVESGYKQAVNQGSERAISQKDATVSQQKYRDLLSAYVTSFDDPHLTLHFRTSINGQARLPKPQRHFECTEINPGILWVTIPHFFPNREQILEIHKIAQTLPAYRDARAIVFDLRHGSGGNSAWGEEMLSSLFTRRYFDQQTQQLHKNLYADWKASYDNMVCLRNYVEKSKLSFGKDSPQYREALKLSDGVARAYKNKQPYYKEEDEPSSTNESLVPLNSVTQPESSVPPDPVKARVIAIVDESCISAGLDFIDMLKVLCPLVLVGHSTGWDRVYIDTNYLTLPSGLADLNYPMKVWRNRRRKDKEVYLPDYKYENLQDTPALQKFILTLI
jgi:hypothetical protein